MAETYPLPKFHFEVDWEGTNIMFSEVSGLDVETEVIEYSDGWSREHTPIKMPGRQKFSNITMKRGVFKDDNRFYEWWNSVSLNTITRRSLTISLLDEKHEPVMTWKVRKII